MYYSCILLNYPVLCNQHLLWWATSPFPQNGPLQIMSVIPNCRPKADFTLLLLLPFGLHSHYPLFPLLPFNTWMCAEPWELRETAWQKCLCSMRGGAAVRMKQNTVSFVFVDDVDTLTRVLKECVSLSSSNSLFYESLPWPPFYTSLHCVYALDLSIVHSSFQAAFIYLYIFG